MLDLAKLAGKMPGISQHFKQEVTASRERVFATDGSQIAPSHHEIAYFFLINVGRIVLHYGQNLYPLLDSVPEVYYKPEDLYIAKQWGIRVDEWMSYRRTVLESQMLAEMATRWVKPPGAHYEPNLALVDGSLICWFIDSFLSLAIPQKQGIFNNYFLDISSGLWQRRDCPVLPDD